MSVSSLHCCIMGVKYSDISDHYFWFYIVQKHNRVFELYIQYIILCEHNLPFNLILFIKIIVMLFY